ncbi:MAG: hypothetical protein ACI4GZ_03265 [Ruminococcus sp.]
MNPKIYKVYSIVVLVVSILSAIGSILGTIVSISNAVFISNRITSFLPDISNLVVVILVLYTLLSLLFLFISYVQFSSMFTFGNMINYVQSNRTSPMKKHAFVASPSFYRSFGTTLFIICFVLGIISFIIMTIFDSVKIKYFLAFPVLPMIPIVISIVFTYINYYVKYKAFGDLLEICLTGEATRAQKDRLAENKPRILRGYCTFLFVVSIIYLIAIAVTAFFIFNPIESLFGTGIAIVFTIYIIFSALVTYAEIAITGCYFDNLGKMIEQYLIEYNMI